MPTTNTKNNGSKKRLGRGLGSLLTTDVGDFDDAPVQDNKPTVSQGVTPNKQTQVKAGGLVASTMSHNNKKAVQATEKPSPKVAVMSVEPSPKTETVENTVVVESKKPAPVPTKESNNSEITLLGKVLSLAIEKIIPNQTQPRKDFHKEPLEELSQSIGEQGVLQPITVRKLGDKFEIIAGERRWRASQLAGLKVVPAIVKDVDDQKSMELALIENLQREDLNTVEEAMGYQLLIDDYDLSQQELAVKVGKSRSSITNALRVLTLPRDIRQMLRQGLLSLGHAKVLLGVEETKTQTKLARKAVQKKLSVRALEKEIIKLKHLKSEDFAELDVSERLAKGMADELQKTLGTKVNINYKKGKGKLEISFYSDDELTQFCEKIKTSWKTT